MLTDPGLALPVVSAVWSNVGYTTLFFVAGMLAIPPQIRAAAIGRAAMMAVVLFVILVGITVIQHLYFRRRISYEIV